VGFLTFRRKKAFIAFRWDEKYKKLGDDMISASHVAPLGTIIGNRNIPQKVETVAAFATSES